MGALPDDEREPPEWGELLERAGPDAAVVLDENFAVVWRSESNVPLTGIEQYEGVAEASAVIEPASIAGILAALERARTAPGRCAATRFVLETPIGRLRCLGWVADISHLRAGHVLLRFTEEVDPPAAGPDSPSPEAGSVDRAALDGAALDGAALDGAATGGAATDVEHDPFHMLVEASTLGLAVVGPRGHLTYCNAAFADLLGVHKGHEELASLAEHLEPDSGDDLRRWAAEVMAGTTTSVTVAVKRDGRRRWLRLDGTRRSSAALGRLHGITVQDVTEVMGARESLRQLLDLLPVLVFAIDRGGRLRFANTAISEFLGADLGGIEGVMLAEVLGEDLAGGLLEAARELTHSGRPVADIKDVFVDPRGESHHLDTTLIPYIDALSDAPTVLAVSRDVTREVNNEALLAALGRNMADLATVHRRAEHHDFVSESVQRLLGWSSEDFLGLRVTDTIHPEDQRRTMALRDPSLSEPASSHTGEVRLLHRDGTWRWFEQHAINLSHVPAIQGMLVFGRDIMDRKARDQQLRHEATHDSLTALLNRSAVIEELELALGEARETGRPVGALFIDLDNFKLVNDALGHEAGDRLLGQVGQAIATALREGDRAGRLGGDEFLLVVREVSGEDSLLRVAHRVSDAVAKVTRDTSYPVTLSIGACVSAAGDTTAGALVRDADAAMYQAKLGGKARTQLFHTAFQQHAARRLEISRELAASLDEGRFGVHFQPVFARRADGLWRLRALEVLARCALPDGRMLPPDEFVPLAEQTGLVVRMGRRVAALTVRALARWHRAGYPVQAWLNLSGSELSRPDITRHLLSALRREGLPTTALGLEITESVLGDAPGQYDATLQELHDAGLTVLIDDFGTGYSSLGALRNYPIDLAKIDRTFCAGMLTSASDAAIVQSVVHIGSVMGFEVVAEGVETGAQLDALADLGCDCVQGWVFSHGVPADEVEANLAAWTEGIAPALGPVGPPVALEPRPAV